MKNTLCFSYLNYKIEDTTGYPGARDNFIYIIFELEDEYIDNKNKKVYKPYDGFLRPLDKFSSWDEGFRKIVTKHCLEKLDGILAEIWIDDVRIK